MVGSERSIGDAWVSDSIHFFFILSSVSLEREGEVAACEVEKRTKS